MNGSRQNDYCVPVVPAVTCGVSGSQSCDNWVNFTSSDITLSGKLSMYCFTSCAVWSCHHNTHTLSTNDHMVHSENKEFQSPSYRYCWNMRVAKARDTVFSSLKPTSDIQLCCSLKLPAWHRVLANFWRIKQLNCQIETISILWQLFLALSLSCKCDWSIVCLHAFIPEFISHFLTFTWRLW